MKSQEGRNRKKNSVTALEDRDHDDLMHPKVEKCQHDFMMSSRNVKDEENVRSYFFRCSFFIEKDGLFFGPLFLALCMFVCCNFHVLESR